MPLSVSTVWTWARLRGDGGGSRPRPASWLSRATPRRRTSRCGRWRRRGGACPARSGPRDVDMEVADRVALELAPVGLVAVDLRQPADPMTLKAAMQG